MDLTVRQHAQQQWNSRACGQLEGDQKTLEYFERVEQDRYRQQPWMHDYFKFERYAGMKVLEIGVGQGTDAVQFARAGAEYHGVDITQNHLSLAARNFSLRGLSADLREADATALPFPNDYFDCVYSFGVLHHIPEMDACLAEIRRVLKPNGHLRMALYHKWSAFHLFCKLIGNGLWHGKLFTLGYAGLLSTIEAGADGKSIKPYVKLYSRREAKKILQGWKVEDVSVHQLHYDHFYPAILGKALSPLIPMLERRLGWYVACQATKP